MRTILVINRSKTLMYIFVVNLLLLNSFFDYAYSAPNITNISGDLKEGQVISISGGGFGANGPHILFYDNFEGGMIGQNIKTGPGSATIGQWKSLNTVPPKYSADTSISGTNAFKVTGVQGVEAGTCGFISLDNITEVFYSWWMYVPSSSPWSGEGPGSNPPNNINWKVMWMTQSSWSTDNDQDLVMIMNPSYWYISGNDARWGTPDYFLMTINKGSWKRMWWWQKDGYNNDGSIKLWELLNTGVRLVQNVTGKTTLDYGAVRKLLSVNGYTRQHNSGTMPTQMFDDIYIATGPNAQARVEIGTGCTGGDYTKCTNFAVSTVNSWNDNLVTATARLGNLSGTVNVFVIDANGNVSNGITAIISP